MSTSARYRLPSLSVTTTNTWDSRGIQLSVLSDDIFQDENTPHSYTYESSQICTNLCLFLSLLISIVDLFLTILLIYHYINTKKFENRGILFASFILISFIGNAWRISLDRSCLTKKYRRIISILSLIGLTPILLVWIQFGYCCRQSSIQRLHRLNHLYWQIQSIRSILHGFPITILLIFFVTIDETHATRITFDSHSHEIFCLVFALIDFSFHSTVFPKINFFVPSNDIRKTKTQQFSSSNSHRPQIEIPSDTSETHGSLSFQSPPVSNGPLTSYTNPNAFLPRRRMSGELSNGFEEGQTFQNKSYKQYHRAAQIECICPCCCSNCCISCFESLVRVCQMTFVLSDCILRCLSFALLVSLSGLRRRWLLYDRLSFYFSWTILPFYMQFVWVYETIMFQRTCLYLNSKDFVSERLKRERKNVAKFLRIGECLVGGLIGCFSGMYILKRLSLSLYDSRIATNTLWNMFLVRYFLSVVSLVVFLILGENSPDIAVLWVFLLAPLYAAPALFVVSYWCIGRYRASQSLGHLTVALLSDQ